MLGLEGICPALPNRMSDGKARGTEGELLGPSVRGFRGSSAIVWHIDGTLLVPVVLPFLQCEQHLVAPHES